MTENELRILIRAILDESGFIALKKEQDDVKRKSASTAQEISASFKNAFGDIAKYSAMAMASVAAGLGFSSKQAMDSERALNRARTAVQINKETWEQWKGPIEDVATAMMNTTVIGDEEVVDMAARMITAIGNVDKAYQHLPLALDLARAFQLDNENAARMVAAALEGETGRLAMLVPAIASMNDILGENATKSQRAEYMIGILQERIGGFAKEEVKTAYGQLLQMKNQLKEIAEAMGKAFMPAVNDGIGAVKKWAISAAEWVGQNEDLVRSIGKVVLSVGLLVTGLSVLCGTVIPAVVSATGTLVAAYKSVELAILAIRIAMLSVPGWGWIAGAAGVISGAAIAAAIAQKELNESLREFDRIAEEASAKAGALPQTMRETEIAILDENKALRDHIALMKDFITPYDSSGEEKKTGGFTEKEIGDAWKKHFDDLKEAKKKAAEHDQQLIESTREAANTTHEFALQEKTLREMIESSDLAVRYYATGALQELINQRKELERTGLGIKSENELTGRPKGTGSRRTDEQDAERSAAHAAELRRQWEDTLIQEGVASHVAAEAAKRSASLEAARDIAKAWQNSHDRFLQMTGSLQDAYRVGVESLVNAEMTGKQRREAIWNTFKSSAIRYISEITTKYLFGKVAEQVADTAALGSATANAAAETVVQVGAAKIEAAAWMKVVYAKQLAFYSWLGPLAPAAAAGTIAAGIAGMQAAGAAALAGFQKGGIVPGNVTGDKVLIRAESGEYVSKRSVTQQNRPVLDYLNSGGSMKLAPAYAAPITFSGGINLYAEGPLSKAERFDMTSWMERELPRVFENLVSARRIDLRKLIR